jgi:hypothetical protein
MLAAAAPSRRQHIYYIDRLTSDELGYVEAIGCKTFFL